MITTREASRANITTSHPREIDHINCGSLQRIADATEAMAKNHVALQNDCDRYKRWFNEENERRLKLERSNAALRGQITKLKKKQLTP